MDFQSVAGNLRESFRVIAASRPGGENRELRGISIASAAVTFQMFNAAFLSAPAATEAELERRILLASLYFGARGLEWACWVCEDWMDGRARKGAARLFEQNGLRHSVDLPGMAAESLAPPPRPPAAMHIRRVVAGPTCDAFCAIGSVCFHVPLAWFREVFEHDAVWRNFAAYVGYVDGEPVSTAAVVAGASEMGLYNVATLPGKQRAGYAETVMRHALEDARRAHGVLPVVLQSTPAGLNLYRRMGFRAVTRIAVYST